VKNRRKETEWVPVEGTLGKAGTTPYNVHLELEMVDGPLWPHSRVPMTIRLVKGSSVPDGEHYILRYTYNGKDEEMSVKRVHRNMLEFSSAP
jgi:hypothetical protein